MRSVDDLRDALAPWAAGEADVRAIAIVGSHARRTARPDSDLDVVILVDDVRARLDHHDWVAEFADVLSVDHEDWGLIQSLRAHYADGVEIEFGLAPTAWATPPIDARTAAVIRDGLMSVWDPDRLFPVAIQAATTQVHGQP